MSAFQLNEYNTVDGAAEKLLSTLNQEKDSKTDHNKDVISFSDALTITKFGIFNYFIIFVSGMVLANTLLETASMGFILPIMQCDLQLTNPDKGVLSAISMVGIIFSSHLWGFLADTKGRRRVIRPTLLAAFVVTVLSSFSHTFWMMVVLRFVNGFFVSGGSATIFAYLGEFHTDKTRSRALMGSSFIFAIGAMFLPLIAFLVLNQDWVIPMSYIGIDYKPWRFFIIVCGLPGLLCGLSLFALPESPKFLLSLNKEAETIQVLEQMYRWNGGKDHLKISHILPEEDSADALLQLNTGNASKSNFLIVFLKTMWNQTMPLFRYKYLRTTLIVCFVQFCLHATTNGLYMWFPHIINSMVEFMKNNPGEHKQICDIVYEKHETLYKTDGTMECTAKLENSTYFYSLVMEITYASSFAFIGLIINRVGKITILFVCMHFFAGCGIAAVFITDPSIAAYAYVLLFLVGVSINVLGTATVDLYPTNLRAMAICISLMLGRLGGVAAANLAGALLDSHCELTFYIACSSLFISAFMILFIPRKGLEESSKKNAEEIQE